MHNFYLHHETILKLTKNCQPQRFGRVLSKYSKHSKSIGEIKDCYDELSIYLKPLLEETTAKKVKSMS